MNDNAWFVLATPDVLTAQLIARPAQSFPAEDLEVTAAPRVARISRRVAPLFRRLRAAAA
jgi:hypothetical protein